jgi:uncharacterized paraquat-inducible protein A
MADLRECPSCALEFEDEGQDTCPYCGYEFPKRRTSVQWVAVLLIVLMLYPAFKGLMYLLG